MFGSNEPLFQLEPFWLSSFSAGLLSPRITARRVPFISGVCTPSDVAEEQTQPLNTTLFNSSQLLAASLTEALDSVIA